MPLNTNLLNNSPLNHGQSRGATPTPSRPTSSHASVGHGPSTGPMHAAGAQSGNLQLLTPPAPATKDTALQKAIQEYVNTLSGEDKTAFRSASDIIEHLQKMQCNQKTLISSSLTSRVEKVLQCVKNFMGSISGFLQSNPEISSLVVGGLNCILTVCISI